MSQPRRRILGASTLTPERESFDDDPLDDNQEAANRAIDDRNRALRHQEVEARRQESEQKSAEKEQARVRNAGSRAYLRSQGIETDRDASGNVVPAQEPLTGKTAVRDLSGNIEKDAAGRPFRMKREEGKWKQDYGSVEIGPNKTDPNDKFIYRRSNLADPTEPPEKFDPETGIFELDDSIRSESGKALLERRKSALRREKNVLRAELARPGNEAISEKKLEEARNWMASPDDPEADEETRAAIEASREQARKTVEAHEAWTKRKNRLSDIDVDYADLDATSVDDFIKKTVAEREATELGKVEVAGARQRIADQERERLEAETLRFQEESAKLEEEEKQLAARTSKGFTVNEIADVNRQIGSLALRRQALDAKASGIQAREKRYNDAFAPKEATEETPGSPGAMSAQPTEGDAETDIDKPAISEAATASTVPEGGTPSHADRPAYLRGATGMSGNRMAQWEAESEGDLRKALADPAAKGADIFLKPNRKFLSDAEGNEVDGSENDAARIETGLRIHGDGDSIRLADPNNSEDWNSAKPFTDNPVKLREIGHRMAEESIGKITAIRDSATSQVNAIGERISARKASGEITPEQAVAQIGIESEKVNAQVKAQEEEIQNDLRKLRSLAWRGVVPMNKVAEAYKAAGADVTELPDPSAVMDSAGPAEAESFDVQLARKHKLQEFIDQNFNSSPYLDEAQVFPLLQKADRKVNSEAARKTGWLKTGMRFGGANEVAGWLGMGVSSYRVQSLYNRFLGNNAWADLLDAKAELLHSRERAYLNQAGTTPRIADSFADAKQSGNLLNYVGETVASQLPMLAEMVVTGPAGGLIGRAIAKNAPKLLASNALKAATVAESAKLAKTASANMPAARNLTRKRLLSGLAREGAEGPTAQLIAKHFSDRMGKLGTRLGTFASSYTGNTGEILNNTLGGMTEEEFANDPDKVDRAILASLTLGVPAALVDVLDNVEVGVFNKFLGTTAKAARETANRGVKQFLMDAGGAAVSGAKSIGKEGLTGLTQGILGVYAKRITDQKSVLDPFTPAENHEIWENALGEAVGGGAFVAGAGSIQSIDSAMRPLQERYQAYTANKKAMTEAEKSAAWEKATPEQIAQKIGSTPAVVEQVQAEYGSPGAFRPVAIVNTRRDALREIADAALAKGDRKAAIPALRALATAERNRREAMANGTKSLVDASSAIRAQEVKLQESIDALPAAGNPEQAQQELEANSLAVSRTKGLLRLYSGLDPAALPSAELAALGLEKKGAEVVPGKESLMTVAPDGALIASDALRKEAAQVAPGITPLIPGTETQELLHHVAVAKAAEAKAKPAEKEKPAKGKPKEKRQFEVFVEGLDEGILVDAVDSDDAIEQVEASGSGDVRNVREVAQSPPPGEETPSGSTDVPPPPAESGNLPADPASHAPALAARITEQSEDKSDEARAAHEGMAGELTSELANWQKAFSKGIRIVDDDAGTGGLAFDDDTLTISTRDLAATAAVVGQKGKDWARKAVLEEVIHSAATKLERAGKFDAAGLYKSLPDALQQHVQGSYRTNNENNAGHEFIRMVVQNELQRKGSDWVAGGKIILTEEAAAGNKLLAGLNKAVKAVLDYLSDLAGNLRKSGADQSLIDYVDGRVAEIEGVMATFRTTKDNGQDTTQEVHGQQELGQDVPESRGMQPLPEQQDAQKQPPEDDAGGTGGRQGTPGSELPPDANKIGPKGLLRGGGASIVQHDAPVRGQWVVQEATEGITSHDDAGRPNPAFNQNIQPRAREKDVYREQARKISKLLSFKRLAFHPGSTTPNTTTATGNPTMYRDGQTITGHGREIGIARSYRENERASQVYKRHLIENAAAFGLDPKKIEGMTAPVLKFMILDEMTPEQVLDFSRDSNQGEMMELSAEEVASQDAARMTPDLLALLDPNKPIEAQTNRRFIQQFVQQVVRPKGSNFQNSTKGDLKRRVQLALFAAAYGGNAQGQAGLSRLSGDTDDGAKRITTALLALAPLMARVRRDVASGDLFPLDISGEIAQAAHDISQQLTEHSAKQAWMNLETPMLPGMEGDDLATSVRKFMVANRGSADAIQEAVSNYTERAYAAGSPKETDMFGRDTPTRESIWALATGSQVAEPPQEPQPEAAPSPQPPKEPDKPKGGKRDKKVAGIKAALAAADAEREGTPEPTPAEPEPAVQPPEETPPPSMELETQTPEDVQREQQEAEQKQNADEARAKAQEKADRPLTGTNTTGQGALFAEDADLFSGPSAEDQNQQTPPEEETPAESKLTPQLATELLALSAEKRTMPFGGYNLELRQRVLLALTGQKVPSAKAGAQAVFTALQEEFGTKNPREIEAAMRRLAETDTAPKKPRATAGKPAATPKPEPAQPTENKIDDFGAKIGGARKDLWGKLRHRLEAELPADREITLSKHWPEPDYEKLIADGANANTLAAFKAVRDFIPPKPRTGYKLKRWAEMVRELHGHMQRMMAGESMFNELAPVARKGSHIDAQIRFYQRIGFPLALKAKGWQIKLGHYSLFQNQKLNQDADIVIFAERNGRSVYGTEGAEAYRIVKGEGADVTEAVDAVIDHAAEILRNEESKPANTQQKAKAESKYGLFSDRFTKDVFIGRRGLNGVIRLKTGFKTPSEAREYLADNIEAIEEQWSGLKAHPDYRRPINEPRQGPERRDGDVTPEMFQESFGFRGVEFGNWVENDRRQQDLNQAYDALMDLAEALSVPPRALSLDGSLGLAFGARGIGGQRAAAAHYEPDFVTINLTKQGGPGALAHEWWHAFDNYFARLDHTGSTAANPLDRWATLASGAPKHMRLAVMKAFQGIVATLRDGPFAQRSTKLDEARSKPYYGTMIEKSARAFERYVRDRLEDRMISSDYLVNLQKDESPAIPTADEMSAGIRQAYDTLFNTLETETTPTGVALRTQPLGGTPEQNPDPDVDSPARLTLNLEPWNGNDPRETTHPASGGIRNSLSFAGRVITRTLGTEYNRRVRSLLRLADGGSKDGVRVPTGGDSLVGRVVSAFEEAFKKRVIFFTAEPGGKPLPRGGLIPILYPNLIAINADGPFSLAFTLGHELGHAIERQAPELYRKAKSIVLDLLKDKDSYIARENLAGFYTGDKLDNEVFNDVLGYFFREPQFWAEMGKRDGTTTARLFEAWRRVLGKFLRAFGSQRNARDAGDMVTPNLEAIRQEVAGMVSAYHKRGEFPAYIPPPLASQPFASRAIRDAEYLAAVEAGDVETARRMVNEAALAAGLLRAYHGSQYEGEITEFDPEKIRSQDAGVGFFFGGNRLASSGYAHGGKLYSVFLRLRNPLRTNVDYPNAPANDPGVYATTLETARSLYRLTDKEFSSVEAGLKKINQDRTPNILARPVDFAISVETFLDLPESNSLSSGSRAGLETMAQTLRGSRGKSEQLRLIEFLSKRDGIIFKDNDVYTVLNPEQIKSADPITRDADGNVIPLSKRFDHSKPSILYTRSFADALRDSGANIEEIDKFIEEASQEKSGERTIGEPRRSGGGGFGEQGDPVIFGTDHAYEQQRQAQSVEDWSDAALDMYRTGYDFHLSRVLHAGLHGLPLTPEESVFAQYALSREATKPLTDEQVDKLKAIRWAFISSGSTVARMLRSRVDQFRTPEERNREFFMRDVLTDPALEAELDKATSPKERDRLLKKDRERLRKIEEAFAKMGTTLEDILSGGHRLDLVGAKITKDAVEKTGEFSGAMEMALGGAENFDTIAKKTGKKAKEVREAYEKMRNATKARLMRSIEIARKAMGLSAQKLNPNKLIGVDFAALAKLSPEEQEREIEKILGRMGMVPPEQIGKRRVVKKKSPIFNPPPPPNPVGPDNNLTLEPQTVPPPPESRPSEPAGMPGHEPGGGQTVPKVLREDMGPRPDHSGRITPNPAVPHEHTSGEGAPVAAVLRGDMGPKPSHGDRIIQNPNQPAPHTPGPGKPVANVLREDMGQRPSKLDRLTKPEQKEWRYSVPAGGDLNNNEDAVRLTRIGQAASSKPMDIVQEIYINNLLSGPQTQVVNLLSNAASVGWEYTAQRFMEAAWNTVFGRKNAANLGEFGHVAKALLPGIMHGFQLAAKTWRTEQDWFYADVLEKQNELFETGPKGEGHRIAIGGTKGMVARMPGRALMATDAFFRRLIAELEASAQGYRIAKAKGLKGDAIRTEIQEQLRPGSYAYHLAAEKADDLIFTRKLKRNGKNLEAVAAHVMDMKRNIPLLSFIVPFIRTPYNIFRTGIRKSPFGAVNLMTQLAKGGLVKYRGGKIDAARQAEYVYWLAEQTLAWAGLMALAGMVEGDDDDDKKFILITGSPPGMLKGNEKELQERTSGGGFTIRIGRKTFSYGRIEPFATILGVSADAIREFKRGGANTEKMSRLMGGLVQQAREKTFLQGLAGIFDFAEDVSKSDDPAGDVVKRTPSYLLKTIVPNLIRQPLRNMDPTPRDYGTAEWWYAALPHGSGAAPKVDRSTGKDKVKSGNAFTRLLWPSIVEPGPLSVADDVLRRWNNRFPAEAWAPPRNQYTMVDSLGQKVRLNAKAYHFLERRSATLARARLAGITRAVTEDNKDRIKKAYEDSRDQARKELRMRPTSKIGELVP